MGYHITLVRSPAGPILWEQLAEAARKLGWSAHDQEREVRLEQDGRLVARVVHGPDGEPWCKLTGDEELAKVIELGKAVGARARGDEFESYRTVDDWYVHPDDKPVRDAVDRASAAGQAKRARQRNIWNGFRLVVLILGVVFFGIRIWTDMQ